MSFQSGTRPAANMVFGIGKKEEFVVLLFEDNGVRCRIGSIDPFAFNINWVGDKATFLANGVQPAIANTWFGTNVVVYKGSDDDGLFYLTGELKDDKFQNKFVVGSNQYAEGRNPTIVCLDDNNNTVVAFHTGPGNDNYLYYCTGTITEDKFITWSAVTCLEVEGFFPSATKLNGDVILTWMDAFSSPKTFYVAEWSIDAPNVYDIFGTLTLENISHPTLASSVLFDTKLMISYKNDEDNFIYYTFINLPRPDKYDKLAPISDTVKVAEGDFPTIVFDSDNRFFIIYQDNNGQLKQFAGINLPDEGPSSYYNASAHLLKAFVQGANESDISNIVLQAGLAGSGDFNGIEGNAPKGSDFLQTLADEINGSIWHKNPYNKAQKATKPSLFSTGDIFSTLSMLAFSIPEVGGIAAAGLTVAKGVGSGAEKQSDWWAKQFKTASNAPRSESDKIIDDLTSEIEDSSLETQFESVMGHIDNYKKSLKRYFGSDTVDRAETDSKKAHLEVAETRSTVLDNLNVKSLLEDNDAWNAMLNVPKGDKKVFEKTLHNPPTISQVTLTTFMDAATTVVASMVAYAFLLHAPDWVFKGPLDPLRKNSSESYDAIKTLQGFNQGAEPAQADSGETAVTDVASHVGGYNAIPCIEKLNELLPQFIQRLDEAEEMYQQLNERLGMISVANDQPPKRTVNGVEYWYLVGDASRDFTLKLHKDKTDRKAIKKLATEGVCTSNIFSCQDSALTSDNTDAFLSNTSNFKTRLDISYHMSTKPGIIFFEIILPGEAIANKMSLDDYNKDLKYFYYPLTDDLANDNGKNTAGYNDAFWTAPLSNGISDPAMPGFLQNAAAQDAVTWMANVLQHYCNRYHFVVDPGNMTNTLQMARITKQVFQNVQENICNKILED